MLYNGNEYPERLMVVGPSTFYGNYDSVYLFGVEFFGVIDPDKCSGGIPEETVCEFSSSHYSLLESDAAEKRCGKDNRQGYVEREETFYYDRSVCNKIAYLARKVWK